MRFNQFLLYLSAAILVVFILAGCEDSIESSLSGTLTGRVFENDNLMPLAGVRLSTNPYSEVVETDSLGYFSIEDIKTGDYTIIASRGGYKSESLTISVYFQETTEIEMVLTKSLVNEEELAFTQNFTPQEKEQIDQLMVQLTWQTTNNDSVDYDLILFEPGNINDPQIFRNLKDTFLVVEGLKFNTNYFWQVVARRDPTNEIYTSIRRFTTRSFPANQILYSQMTNELMQLYVGDTILQKTVQITFGPHHNWNAKLNDQKSAIAFQSTRDVESYLYLMKLDGTAVRRLTGFRVGGYFNQIIEFDWAPNGANIIFTSYNNLYRINADGSDLQVIANAPDNKHFREVVYSTDGTKIYAIVVGSHVLDRQIYQMNSNGSNLTLLYNDPEHALAHLDVSPDGKSLLFSKDMSGHVSSTGRLLDAQIFELNILTGDLRNFSQIKDGGTNDLQAVYSPDGGRIVFVNSLNTLTATPSIWVMNINKDRRQKLKEGALMPSCFE